VRLWQERLLKIKPGYDFCFQDEYEKYFVAHKEVMIQNYNEHIQKVTRKIPAHRLLVWNVKGNFFFQKKTDDLFLDGWEPLAKFLDKPVPKIPLPSENTSGSNIEWRRKNWNQHPVMKEAMEQLFISFVLLCSFLFIIITFILLRPVDI